MTGSFINKLYSESKSNSPEIGMGVTECCWSDRHAYSVIDVISPREIVVQRDHAQRIDNYGMSDCQTWEYSNNPEGNICTLTLRKNGRWIRKGFGQKNSSGWIVGKRDEHYDYSF
jgi:hypothetical protein